MNMAFTGTGEEAPTSGLSFFLVHSYCYVLLDTKGAVLCSSFVSAFFLIHVQDHDFSYRFYLSLVFGLVAKNACLFTSS